MKCLFTYEWVKLPSAHIPAGKGLMGPFLRLASRAVFRSGKARYCGYTNDVNAGAWAGGIAGLKSIIANVPQRDIYAQQESKLSMQSHAFVQMLAKRGLIEDDAIQNEAVRKADKEKRRNMHHNTLLLLRSYRDIRWMLQCFPDTIAEELDAPLHDLDTLLDLVNAEIDLDNYRLENRIQSMRLSRSMMDRLNEAVSILRDKPQNGDMLYNIIYLTYIAPERLTVVEICSKLHISDRQYYRLRQQALNIISIRL